MMQIKLGCYRVGNIWKSQQDIFKFLVSHFRIYHQMEIQDVYKLFYQGVYGSAHSMRSSTKEFEDELKEEFARVEKNSKQPLWESIHPEGKIMRIHLAAYKSKNKDIDQLSTLCIWTAEIADKEVESSENLSAAMDTFYKLCKSRKIPKFNPLDVAVYQRWLMENKFPAVHHSEIYHRKYDPHYRLIHRDFLPILF